MPAKNTEDGNTLQMLNKIYDTLCNGVIDIPFVVDMGVKVNHTANEVFPKAFVRNSQ